MNFKELRTSTVFYGYTGIKSTNEMDFVVPTILVNPDPDKERGLFLTKFSFFLIPRRSAFSPMPPIGTSGVELAYNK